VSLTLEQILGGHWQGFAANNHAHLCTAHYRAVRSVLYCRTPALGGQTYQCAGCRRNHYAYHSCNHRNCPKCGARDQGEWSAKQEARLLPAPYFLVTFTIPEALRAACRSHPRELYDLLLKESAGALQDVLETKLGGTGGFTSILHTWTRQLQHHPHVHIIIPGVAYDKKSRTLKHPAKPDFLVHGAALAERFKNRLEIALKEVHPEIHKALTPAQLAAFAKATKNTKGTNGSNGNRGTNGNKWVTDVLHVGAGKSALRYLARYVRRSAFSDRRLLGYDRRGNVMVGWTSSQTGQRGTLRMHPHELIRRWLLHVLPQRFTRLRHYGFMAGAARETRLRVRALLGAFGEPAPDIPEQEPFRCDHCGGELRHTGKLDRIRPRGPPAWRYIPEEEEEGGEAEEADD
jgi:hypothetical protein